LNLSRNRFGDQVALEGEGVVDGEMSGEEALTSLLAFASSTSLLNTVARANGVNARPLANTRPGDARADTAASARRGSICCRRKEPMRMALGKSKQEKGHYRFLPSSIVSINVPHGANPGRGMVIVGVDQRPVDIEDDCFGHEAHGRAGETGNGAARRIG
jgi:hypothetical protein